MLLLMRSQFILPLQSHKTSLNSKFPIYYSAFPYWQAFYFSIAEGVSTIVQTNGLIRPVRVYGIGY